MLFNGHTTDDGCDLDLLAVLNGDDSFDHVFDLDRKLSGWTHNKTDAVLVDIFVSFLLLEFLYLADDDVEHRDSETESLSLTGPGSDDHIHVGCEVHQ